MKNTKPEINGQKIVLASVKDYGIEVFMKTDDSVTHPNDRPFIWVKDERILDCFYLHTIEESSFLISSPPKTIEDLVQMPNIKGKNPELFFVPSTDEVKQKLIVWANDIYHIIGNVSNGTNWFHAVNLWHTFNRSMEAQK